MRRPMRGGMALGIAVAAACARGGSVAGATGRAADSAERGPLAGVPALPAVLDRVPAKDTSIRVQPGLLATVKAVPVTHWTGPGGRPFEVEARTFEPSGANNRPFGAISLHNAARERSPDLGQYPCTACHLGRAMVLNDRRILDAHQNIQPQHPRQTGATCGTCHAPDDVERLALRTGERVTMDHAYRLCAQCHFQQVEAWAAGAHGKRLDGWQGRRVVMGCAECHDPHRPALAPRIPFRAPVLDHSRRPEP